MQDHLTPTRFQLKKYVPSPWTLDESLKNAVSTPSEWFSERFPWAARQFGTPFLEARYMASGDTERVRPMIMSHDFFAAMLGGEKRFGHDVVFYTPDETFYFKEPVAGHYAPTTEEKLETLVSQYLIRCAEDLQLKRVDIEQLFSTHRRSEQLKAVVQKAKSILAVDESFFYGPDAHKRMRDGTLLGPLEGPPHQIFVKNELEYREGAILLLRDFVRSFEAFCAAKGIPLDSRRGLKAEAQEMINQYFGVRYRKDLKDEAGKYQNGWKHITFRNQPPATWTPVLN